MEVCTQSWVIYVMLGLCWYLAFMCGIQYRTIRDLKKKINSTNR